MARPAVPINITNMMAALGQENRYLTTQFGILIKDAVQSVHPDYVTAHPPAPMALVKELRKIPEGLYTELTARKMWGLMPEVGYTTMYQLFKYVRAVNAAFEKHLASEE